MQVQDLCTTILTTVGALAAGETPAPEDLAIAQSFLNNFLGSLNAAVRKSIAATFPSSMVAFVPVATTVNLTDLLTLPAGWARALTFNVALDLTEPYGKPVTQTLATKAAESRAEIVTAANSPAPTV